MSDTEPCPPLTEGEAQLSLAFMDEWNRSPLEGQSLSLPNPPGAPCFCSEPCMLGSHRRET